MMLLLRSSHANVRMFMKGSSLGSVDQQWSSQQEILLNRAAGNPLQNKWPIVARG